MGSVAKSYMMTGFLIYEEISQIFNHILYEDVLLSIVIYDFETDPFWISFYSIWWKFYQCVFGIRHSGLWEAADEAVLNKVHKKVSTILKEAI